MFRWLSIIIIMALLMSSACFAGIDQHEDFGIGARNRAHVVGSGSECHLNLVGFVRCQKASDLCSHNRACQIQGAIIGQCAKVGEHCGAACVRQSATISCSQDQSSGGCWSHCPSASQSQSINLSFGQNVSTHGSGSAFGAQGGVVAQHQTLVTPRGIGTQSQFVGVVQIGAVSGGRCSNASVSQTVNVIASQHQSF